MAPMRCRLKAQLKAQKKSSLGGEDVDMSELQEIAGLMDIDDGVGIIHEHEDVDISVNGPHLASN